MLSPEGFRAVVTQSGLSKYELAKLYGVARQTIYDWAAGSMPKTGSLLARMADAVTVSLRASITKGVLPMAPVDRAIRQRRIDAMRKTLEKLPATPS